MPSFDFSKNIVLESDRARLEPLTLDHVVQLKQISIAHPELLVYSPSPFGGIQGIRKYVEQALEQKEAKQRYPFAVYDYHREAYAGSTSFMAISNKDLRLEIGSTWIGPEFQRSGLNRMMKFVMLSYAFEALGFERVEFKTDSRNIQSLTAIKAIGGVEEGTLRNHTVLMDGYRRDTVYFSILKSEWPQVKEERFHA